MDVLRTYHEKMLEQVDDQFHRFLYHQLPWNDRMLAIKGLRGTGKTTLMLQHLKYGLGAPKEALYVTADHPWFYNHTLLETAETFEGMGGKFLFVDEIHKYANWSRELKNIYDSLGCLRVVFSASSALDIYRGESDLSRRVLSYELPGLSFREYLDLAHGHKFTTLSLDEVLNNHSELTRQINGQIKPLPLFKTYLQWGYLPIFRGNDTDTYLPRLHQILNTVLEYDISFIEGYSSSNLIKIKQLLGIIAETVPFEPNISSLARKMHIGRDTILNYLQHLEKGRILNMVRRHRRGVAALQKPDKIYLENPNFNYALSEHPEIGTLRESFLLNQLINIGKTVSLPDKGDFYLEKEGLIIEVGGKDKGPAQIKDADKAIIAADDLEYGFGNKVPLWLFGFLY